MGTLDLAAVLFAVGIAFGLAMFVGRLRSGRNPPIWLLTLHGGAVGFALAMLGLAVLREDAGGLASVALAVFGAAALGGATLFTMHMRGRLLPVPFLLVHAAVAATGYALLLVHVLTAR